MMKTFLDHFAAILGTFTISIILVSVTHELGYFTIIGLHFQTLLTATDYLSNSIVWLPYVALMMWGWGEWGKLRAEPEKKRWNWRNWREWVWPLIVAAFLLFMLLTMTWPPTSISMITVMTVIVFVWSRVWMAVYWYLGIVDEDLKPIVREFVLWGPPLLAAVYAWGIVNAGQDLRSDDPYFVHYKNSETTDVKVFLRSFDKGVLLKDFESYLVEFQPWENVAKIERFVEPPSRPLFCYLFNVCQQKTAPPPP